MSNTDLQTRLESLEARVHLLENPHQDDANPPERADTELLERLGRRTGGRLHHPHLEGRGDVRSQLFF